jgi:hypothetical protein
MKVGNLLLVTSDIIFTITKLLVVITQSPLKCFSQVTITLEVVPIRVMHLSQPLCHF